MALVLASESFPFAKNDDGGDDGDHIEQRSRCPVPYFFLFSLPSSLTFSSSSCVPLPPMSPHLFFLHYQEIFWNSLITLPHHCQVYRPKGRGRRRAISAFPQTEQNPRPGAGKTGLYLWMNGSILTGWWINMLGSEDFWWWAFLCALVSDGTPCLIFLKSAFINSIYIFFLSEGFCLKKCAI